MKLLHTLFFLTCELFFVTTDCIKDGISKLSTYDNLLSGRLKMKNTYIQQSYSKDDFIRAMDNFTSNGTEYTSKGTSDWVSEIIQGLDGSYNEHKNPDAGYVDITNRLHEFFDENTVTTGQLYFKMRMTGIFTHNWIILRNPHSYRIYQSMEDAYSLKAWLTVNSMDFRRDSLFQEGDIMYWKDNYDRIESILENSQYSMKKLALVPDTLRPWLTLVKDYNKSLITHNLRRAWVNYGSSKNIEIYVFKNQYIQTLHNFTVRLQQYLKRPREDWTRQMDDYWIDLFGSPNKYCFPGNTFDADTLLLPNYFKIEVKILKKPNELKAIKAIDILAESVSHSTEDLGSCSKAQNVKMNSILHILALSLILFYISL